MLNDIFLLRNIVQCCGLAHAIDPRAAVFILYHLTHRLYQPSPHLIRCYRITTYFFTILSFSSAYLPIALLFSLFPFLLPPLPLLFFFLSSFYFCFLLSHPNFRSPLLRTPGTSLLPPRLVLSRGLESLLLIDFPNPISSTPQ